MLLHVPRPSLLVLEGLAARLALVALGRRRPRVLLSRLLRFRLRGTFTLLSLVLLVLLEICSMCLGMCKWDMSDHKTTGCHMCLWTWVELT